MTYKEAIEILRKHNAWRRYDGPVGEGPEMVSPKELGEAIDTVCDAAEGRNERAKEFTWEDVYSIIYTHLSMLRESEWQAAEVEDRCKEILRRFNEHKKNNGND